MRNAPVHYIGVEHDRRPGRTEHLFWLEPSSPSRGQSRLLDGLPDSIPMGLPRVWSQRLCRSTKHSSSFTGPDVFECR